MALTRIERAELRVEGLSGRLYTPGSLTPVEGDLGVFIPDLELDVDLVCFPNGQCCYTERDMSGESRLPERERMDDFQDVPCVVRDRDTNNVYPATVGLHVVDRVLAP